MGGAEAANGLLEGLGSGSCRKKSLLDLEPRLREFVG